MPESPDGLRSESVAAAAGSALGPVVLDRRALAGRLADAVRARGPDGDADVVWQVSSGTSEVPIRVPRARADIEDTFARVARPFVREFGRLPARVALLGGVSHEAVAADGAIGSVVLRSFTVVDALDERGIAALDAFSPEAVSCYPSVARELVDAPGLVLARLLAIKLGGERVFAADVERLSRRFPGSLLIEQYGSTEAPAVALRVHRGGRRSERFELETGRFSFLLAPGDGWRPLVVRDGCPHAPAALRAFYDTGDEVLVRAGQVVDVRRRGDPAAQYFELADALLAQGCRQVRVDPHRGRLEYTGDVRLPAVLSHAGSTLHAVHAESLPRGSSRKLPLLFGEGADG